MKKQYIEFETHHQRITRTDDFFVVGGSKNYLHARFCFCDDWADEQVTAVFSAGGKSYTRLIVDNECCVPWEVLQCKNFFVGCMAGSLITSNAAEVKVNACGVQPGIPGVEPTPSAYEQIVFIMEETKAIAQSVREDADNGEFDGPPGPKGDPGAVKYMVVTELPKVGDGDTIYLVPVTSLGTVAEETEDNLFDEYIFVDGKWEKIGSTAVAVDITGYVKIADMDALVKDAVTANTEPLTDEEKAAAQEWLGIESAKGAVLYTAQSLSDAQKAQARANIGVTATGGSAEVELDDTLTVQGMAADSKAVGDHLGEAPFYDQAYPFVWSETKGYYDTNGTFVSQSSHTLTEHITINGAKQITVSQYFNKAGQSCIQFYDESKTIISVDGVSDSSMTQQVNTFEVPDGAVYFTFWTYNNHKGHSYATRGAVAVPLNDRVDGLYNKLQRAAVVPFEIVETGCFYRDCTILASSSYGLTNYIPCNGGDIFTVKSKGVGATQYRCAFYDADKNMLCMAHFGEGTRNTADETVEIAVPYANAKYIRFTIYGGVAEITKTDVYMDSTPRVIEDNKAALADALQLGITQDYSTTDAFTMLHFSDIHSDVLSLMNIQHVKDYLADILDDTICTGDMLRSNFTNDNMDFWNVTDGTILTCIGNHEVLQAGSADYRVQPTEAELYATFFAPYIANWGDVVHPDGKLYYYKDYAAKKVRLIVLNALYPTEAEVAEQNTWLANTLTDAKSKGYCVVLAQHYYPKTAQKIECTFSANVNFPVGVTDEKYCHNMETYHATIQNFIDNGGNFACILCGHRHTDYIAVDPSYPKQVYIGVGGALCPSNVNMPENTVGIDARRVNGTKTQDCMNVFSVDAENKLIKIVRIGADRDMFLRSRKTLVLNYATSPATVVYDD